MRYSEVLIGLAEYDALNARVYATGLRKRKREIPGLLFVTWSQYKESTGGHTWINWRQYLNEYVPLLFN